MPCALAQCGKIRLCARRSIEPKSGPGRGGHHHGREWNEQQTAADGRSGRGVRHRMALLSLKSGGNPVLTARLHHTALTGAVPHVRRLARRGQFLDITSMDPNAFDSAQDLWVFAYGSLMWRPEVTFFQADEGRLPQLLVRPAAYFLAHPRDTQQTVGRGG